MNLLMLDICCGTKSASAAMAHRGWEVVTLDNDPRFTPGFLADVRQWMWHGARPDLVWCSPPCTEFSREFMPWSATGQAPDMSIVLACHDLIRAIQPRYWVIENTLGAAKWFKPHLGKYTMHSGPYYLWGSFPDLSHVRRMASRKVHMSSGNEVGRGAIPYKLSMAMAMAIENQPRLL